MPDDATLGMLSPLSTRNGLGYTLNTSLESLGDKVERVDDAIRQRDV